MTSDWRSKLAAAANEAGMDIENPDTKIFKDKNGQEISPGDTIRVQLTSDSEPVDAFVVSYQTVLGIRTVSLRFPEESETIEVNLDKVIQVEKLQSQE